MGGLYAIIAAILITLFIMAGAAVKLIVIALLVGGLIALGVELAARQRVIR